MDTGEEVPQFETMQDFMAWAQTDPNQMRVRPGANNLPEGQPASALHWYERTGGGVLDGGSAFSPDAQAPQSRQQAPESRRQVPQSRQQAPVTAAADPVSTDSPSFGESAGAEAARRVLSESLSEPPCRRARAGVRGAHNGSLGKAGRRDPLGCETGKAAPPAPLMEAQLPVVAINWAVRLSVSDSEEASAHGVSRANSTSSQRSADPTPPPSPKGAQAGACPQLFRSTQPSQRRGGSQAGGGGARLQRT